MYFAISGFIGRGWIIYLSVSTNMFKPVWLISAGALTAKNILWLFHFDSSFLICLHWDPLPCGSMKIHSNPLQVLNPSSQFQKWLFPSFVLQSFSWTTTSFSNRLCSSKKVNCYFGKRELAVGLLVGGWSAETWALAENHKKGSQQCSASRQKPVRVDYMAQWVFAVRLFGNGNITRTQWNQLNTQLLMIRCCRKKCAVLAFISAWLCSSVIAEEQTSMNTVVRNFSLKFQHDDALAGSEVSTRLRISDLYWWFSFIKVEQSRLVVLNWTLALGLAGRTRTAKWHWGLSRLNDTRISAPARQPAYVEYLTLSQANWKCWLSEVRVLVGHFSN